IIDVLPGEIYIPVNYRSLASVGEQAVVGGKELVIAGYLRDSTMNSSLSSSKRFLVNSRDFLELQKLGNTEYLIEFRLHDLSALRSFEADYIDAGLEANGPVVTYGLFRLMNALSEGLMIGIVLLVSILIVTVALMCIRFTLLAKIEE